MDAELVSVVIPCYNQAHFLSEAIESVLAQSYSNFEVIVVDDGSTDNTSEVAAHYPGVRLVCQENQGVSGARNSGLAVSKGEYVVFLDADERLLPGALKAGLECLKAHPKCAFVSGRGRHIRSNGSPPAGRRRHRIEGDLYGELLRGCSILVPTVMYRRSVFEVVGGFDTSLRSASDYDLYLRIGRSFPIYCYDTPVAEIRRHEANKTLDSARMLSNSMAVLRSQRKHIKGHKQYKEAYKAGVRWEQGNYGYPLVEKVRAYLWKREWKQGLRGMLVLLRYYPKGLPLLLLNKRSLEQRKLTRRLLVRKQDLEVLEQRLKESESIHESESTSAEELRQEVRWLRWRIQRVERRMQNLNQRSQTKRNGKVWKLLNSLGRMRAKVLGR